MMKKIFLMMIFFSLSYVLCSQTWSFQEKFCVDGLNEYDRFGNILFQDETHLLVSAIQHDLGSSGEDYLLNSGAVYLFRKSSNGNWDIQQKLVAPGQYRQTNANFAFTGVVTETHIVVGVPNQDIVDVEDLGAIFIFKKNTNGDYIFSQVFYPEVYSGEDSFGSSIALSGDDLFIGAPGYNHVDSEGNNYADVGAVFVYTLDEDNQWNYLNRMLPEPIIANARWGKALAVRNNRLFIGEPGYYDQENSIFGRVKYYEYESLQIPRGWKFRASILNPFTDNANSFGSALAYDGETLVVGDPLHSYDQNQANKKDYAGAIYTYTKHPLLPSWKLGSKLVARHRSGSARFGSHIRVDHDFIVVGSRDDKTDENGANELTSSGAAYIYSKKGGGWSYLQKLVSQEREEWKYFATSVGLGSDKITVSDYFSDIYGSNMGAVESYQYNPATGLFDIASDKEMALVYPNPFDDDLIIELSGSSQPASYRVLSITGQEICRGDLFSSCEVISLNQAKSGIYFLEIYHQKAYFIEKIIKK